MSSTTMGPSGQVDISVRFANPEKFLNFRDIKGNLFEFYIILEDEQILIREASFLFPFLTHII